MEHESNRPNFSRVINAVVEMAETGQEYDEGKLAALLVGSAGITANHPAYAQYMANLRQQYELQVNLKKG